MLNNEIILEDLKKINSHLSNVEKLKNKSVLVTGATGMLACYYIKYLEYLNKFYDYNINIYALARNKSKLNSKLDLDNSDIIPVIQDVKDSIQIEGDLDYIIHMACSADPKNLSESPASIIETSLIGMKNAIDLAKEKNAEIIFTSTREIYGGMPKEVLEIKETDMGILDCTEIRSCYPESKRMCENYLICAGLQYGISYKIVRLAHAYGPGMAIFNDGRIMADLLACVIEGKDIVLKSTGEALRAFCYVGDAVEALLTVTLSDKKNEIYNISNETEEIAIKDLAQKLVEMYPERELKVVFDIQNNNNQYVKFARTKLDNTKLYGLGFNFSTSLEEGIRNTVEYYETTK